MTWIRITILAILGFAVGIVAGLFDAPLPVILALVVIVGYGAGLIAERSNRFKSPPSPYPMHRRTRR